MKVITIISALIFPVICHAQTGAGGRLADTLSSDGELDLALRN